MDTKGHLPSIEVSADVQKLADEEVRVLKHDPSIHLRMIIGFTILMARVLLEYVLRILR